MPHSRLLRRKQKRKVPPSPVRIDRARVFLPIASAVEMDFMVMNPIRMDNEFCSINQATSTPGRHLRGRADPSI